MSYAQTMCILPFLEFLHDGTIITTHMTMGVKNIPGAWRICGIAELNALFMTPMAANVWTTVKVHIAAFSRGMQKQHDLLLSGMQPQHDGFLLHHAADESLLSSCLKRAQL